MQGRLYMHQYSPSSFLLKTANTTGSEAPRVLSYVPVTNDCDAFQTKRIKQLPGVGKTVSDS